MGKQWSERLFILGGSKITADGDCSHDIKRHLLLGRKAMTNLDRILKRRDITLLTNVCIVKAMVFPVVMYGCESWTIKRLSIEKLMLLNSGVGEDSWESLGLQERSNQSILKEIYTEYSLEGLMLKLKLQALATWCEELTHWERPWCCERLKTGEERDNRGQNGWMASLNWWI